MTVARSFALVFACSVGTATFACVGDDPAASSSSSSSSGSTTSSGGSSGTPGDDGGTSTCTAPKTTCGADCVDLQTSNDHCGDCATKCNGTTCFNGVCDGARVKDVAAGSETACAVRTDGSVYCWGRADLAALGHKFTPSEGHACGATSRCDWSPTKVGGLDPVESISVGYTAACVVTNKKEVWCWGRNSAGETGDPAKSGTCEQSEACVDKPTKIDGLPPKMAEVSLGIAHACARTTDGEVWCWGANGEGRLGRGDLTANPLPAKIAAGTPPAKQVAVSMDQFGTSCIVTNASTVYCWGHADQSALGHADSQTCGSFTCDPTPKLASGTGIAGGVSKVLPGASHTCALTDAKEMKCWGYFGYGVGPDPTSIVARTVKTGVTQISGRRSFACEVRTDGVVECLGESPNGQVGVLIPANDPQCKSGTPWPCKNTPQPVTLQNPVRIDSGTLSVALRDDGKIFVWGLNTMGQLGRDPASGPKQCPKWNDVGTSPCSEVPVEVTLP